MVLPDFVIEFASKYATYILAAFVISEVLGNMPSVKENSVFQVIVKFLTAIKDAILKPTTPAA